MAAILTDAYAAAGFHLNQPPLNQWSAVSSDGNRVALSVWDDEIDRRREPWQLDFRDHPTIQDWMDRTGNMVRRRHIQHALDRCGGRFDLILCKAADSSARVRKVKQAESLVERFGVIRPEEFDPLTGAFRLELRRVEEG